MKGIDKRTVIHCPTPEDAAQVLAIFMANKLKWNTGVSYKEENNYHFYKGETCYQPLPGLFARREYYKQKGYKIITAQEFIQENII